MQAITGMIAGLTFGLGLALSGMTQPGKVLAFLDVAGAWDPSLAFVMAGAIAVYAPAYHYITKRTTPWYAKEFSRQLNTGLDAPLLIGAGIFGVGWGLAGYCPGPGLVAAGSGQATAWLFVAGMLTGMWLFRAQQALRASRPSGGSAGTTGRAPRPADAVES